MKLKSEIALTGSKKYGWTITVSDNLGFSDDIAITQAEAIMLCELLKRKLK